MFDVIGSAARAVASQQDAPAPPVTFSAAFPYLSLTTAFSSSFAIAVASGLTSSSLDTSAQKKGSVAAFDHPQPRRARLDGCDGRLDLGGRVGLERVAEPAAPAPVAQPPPVPQGLEGGRQARPARVQDV